MAVPLEQFVKQLTDSGIISPGKLENFIPPKAAPKDAQELARELVKQKQLTKFQAQEIYQGRARSLILGNYTILDRIGAGGMGQVFKAEHRRMHRLVAIKMLPAAMTKDAAALARFEREVTAAARLSHSNIVAAHDADEAGGVHFLVMEYVEGQDLSALVKKDGPLSVAKAVNYVLQAARGLELAHGEGVIHRDIKPANLLLDKKGVVKILDMGLARLDHPGGDAATQAELTGTGAVMGTVDYMAPEQALNTKHADRRADIYSLGITLYYLIAGKAAYDGETLMEKLMGHQTKPIPNLQEVQANTPNSVQAIFSKMVAKKKEDRYQSMTEVIADLEKCQASLSGTALAAGSPDLSSATATLKSSPSTAVGESELTAAFGNRLLQAIPAVERYEEPEKKSGLKLSRPALIGLVAAGLLGVLILAGIIVSLRTKDGTDQTLLPQGEGGRRPDEGAIALVSAAPPLAKAPFDAAQAKAHQAAWAKHLGTTVEATNSVGAKMILIPPGEFLMGNSDEQVETAFKVAEELKVSQGDKDLISKAERPQHRVVITKPFLMSATEVTVGEFRKFVEATKYITEAEQYGFGDAAAKVIDEKTTDAQKQRNWRVPGYAVTDESPVLEVTWNDACAFCNWLSEQEHRTPWYRPDGKGGWLIAAQASGYRLPTEAEWEYCCRAGTTTQYSFGDDYAELDQYGWYSVGKAQPVALKLPNPFGLHDMHGNLWEWCQDFYDEKWYEKPQPNDPKGPAPGSGRVIRGGGWNDNAFCCRCAFRNNQSPSRRNYNLGFRPVRVLDTPADSQLATGTAASQPNQPWNTPAFQLWMKDVQAMPAEKQIDAVAKKLHELNPDFDPDTPHKIDKGVVTEFQILKNAVTDIAPLRALGGLVLLRVGGPQLTDASLEHIKTLPKLERLFLRAANVTDAGLAQIKEMRALTQLELAHTKITSASLNLLGGLNNLVSLDVSYTNVSDAELERLAQPSNLSFLSLSGTLITDAGLEKLKSLRALTNLHLRDTNRATGGKVTAVGVAALQKALPNCKIEWDGATSASPAGEGAKAVAGQPNQPWNTPTFQAWMKDVAAMPAEKQVEAVSKKLVEVNPGFDGKATGIDSNGNGGGTPKIEEGVVTGIGLSTDNVTDISPLRALVGLQALNCSGSFVGQVRKSKLSDLSPLKGLPLTFLTCNNTQVSDLSPLEGMPLSKLSCGQTQVADLSPLRGMPLTSVTCYATNVSDLSPLRGMPLVFLSCNGTKVSNLSPLAGMPLANLSFSGTQVSDLSSLRGMPLTTIECDHTPVSDLSPLEGMKLTKLCFTPEKITKGRELFRQLKSLKIIGFGWQRKDQLPADEFWKKYDAGEFGKPITNINDPAFQKWLKDVAAMPAEEQVKAVSKKLVELNPGFDGKTTGVGGWIAAGMPKIDSGVVTEIGVVTDNVEDISPVRALAGLKALRCSGIHQGKGGRLSDLSPLQAMALESLSCAWTQVSDLSPLRGMPLTTLSCEYTQVSDLSALRGMPLQLLGCHNTPISDLSPLQGMPLTRLSCSKTKITSLSALKGLKLTELYCSSTAVSDLSPVKGMPLTALTCDYTQVSDLSPLGGMPLESLVCRHSQVSDLSPLQDCKGLKSLDAKGTKVTPAAVAALQKARPNCKIEWDGPTSASPAPEGAKPDTPQPAASGRK